VTSELSRARTPEEVVSAAVRHGARAVQAESCVVWLSREDGGLHLVDSWGLPESERERWRDLPPDPAVPGLRVVEAGAPLWVDTDEEYERLSPEIFARQKALGRLRPYGALPLTTDGRRTGVLVFAFQTGHRFSSDEKAFSSR
jgi:GAF domain-containing protein